VLLALAGIGAGCTCERRQLANINVSVEVQRLDQELFAVNPDSIEQQIPALQDKYGDFFTHYCESIISVGTPDDLDFVDNLAGFLRDEVAYESYQKTQAIFPSMDALNATLTKAFKRYKLNFPNDSLPQIIAYVSGFNESVMLTENAVGIGLDKFLGADYELYHELGFYAYLVRSMYPTKVPVDIVRSFAQGLYPYAAQQDELLNRMMWEGKLLYFTQQLLPETPDTALFGFSAAQLDLCRKNEAYMWLYLIENKLLFSTNAFTIAKFTQDRPFTQEFSREAPGKAANWLGYRIVRSYMKRNSEQTLAQLMLDTDYRRMLDGAGYRAR
jgi:hypothetical protein